MKVDLEKQKREVAAILARNEIEGFDISFEKKARDSRMGVSQK